MALIDKASLLFVPSVVAQEKAFNILPSGNRAPDSTDQNSGYDQTRADFTFDRGTDHGATRIGSDGLIKKYRENLLLQSNQFSDGDNWGLQNASVTSGQSGYDGTNDAWLFSHSSITAYLYQPKTLSASINTISIYAKQGTSATTRLDFATASFAKGASCTFNLSNGTAGSVTHYGSSSGFLATINAVSNGWYRISLTGVTTADTWYHELALTSGNVLIQNAQLETGLVATDYLDSGATTAKAGVLIDLPRINYDANGENGSLLLEPQRANLIVNSEALSIGTSGSSVEQNTSETISPEGFYNATKVLGSTTYLAKGVGSAFSGNNTTSVFLKKGNDSTIGVYMYDGAYYRANFNLESGTIEAEVNGATATIENYGNGWYRCSIYKQTPANVVEVGIDGIVGYCYTYGWQHEYNASYPSSYIPNHGTSGGVTRAADVCLKTGVSDLINDGDGTLYMEVTPTNFEGDQRFGVSDNIGANRIVLRLFNPSNLQLSCVINSSVEVSIFNSGYSAGNTYKIAGAWKNNDAVIYVNGVQVATDTNCNITPSNPLTRISFDNGVGTAKWENPVTQTMYFPTRLTNAELATLTTL